MKVHEGALLIATETKCRTRDQSLHATTNNIDGQDLPDDIETMMKEEDMILIDDTTDGPTPALHKIAGFIGNKVHDQRGTILGICITQIT